MLLFLIDGLSGRFEPMTFLFGAGIVSIRLHRQTFDGKKYFLIIKLFVCSFYYSTCKFDRAKDEFDRTRRFETLHNCCHQERLQMFLTTPIGATSMNFVVKRRTELWFNLRILAEIILKA